ncbi:MAG: hypothetical protein H7A51_12825 [Akkermansiaceae bacterium]|nr:hypothetical protein [Akkermansiaceae bacterium]
MKTKKYIQLAAILISAPLILTSCGEKKTEGGTGKADTENPAVKPYPLDTCVVSGEELGSMGDAYVFVHQGQEIKMCCKKCLKKFNADPDKYLAMLNKGKASTDAHDHEDHSGHNHE